MFFGPVLENKFKVGADPYSLFEKLLNMLIQEKFESVGDKHEIEY